MRLITNTLGSCYFKIFSAILCSLIRLANGCFKTLLFFTVINHLRLLSCCSKICKYVLHCIIFSIFRMINLAIRSTMLETHILRIVPYSSVSSWKVTLIEYFHNIEYYSINIRCTPNRKYFS